MTFLTCLSICSYPFYPHPDILYLSGCTEAKTTIMLDIPALPSEATRFVMFVEPKSPRQCVLLTSLAYFLFANGA